MISFEAISLSSTLNVSSSPLSTLLVLCSFSLLFPLNPNQTARGSAGYVSVRSFFPLSPSAAGGTCLQCSLSYTVGSYIKHLETTAVVSWCYVYLNKVNRHKVYN